MRILSLDEIKEGLLRELGNVPAGVGNFGLRTSSLGKVQIHSIEEKLKIRLPADFLDLLLTFDFSELSIGGVFFGNCGAFDDFLIRMNTNPEWPWWSGKSRPIDRILVAGTDGYVILLDANSGEVLAFERGSNDSKCKRIANNFRSFIEAVGTIALAAVVSDENLFITQICEFTGADRNSDFWKDRIKGFQ